MADRLAGKTAIITGAGDGIGAAAVNAFVREGAAVVAVDISRSKLEQLTRTPDLESPERVVIMQGDVTDENTAFETVTICRTAFGHLDILLNVVGGSIMRKAFHELSVAEWHTVLRLNLDSVFAMTKQALLVMCAQRSGTIINTSSQMGIVGAPQLGPYNAAKGGILNLTRSLAAEYASYGIRVNAVCPGATRTQSLADDFTELEVRAGALEEWIRRHPLKRAAEPEEVAAGMLFLASDEASFVTGTGLVIDGGYTAV